MGTGRKTFRLGMKWKNRVDGFQSLVEDGQSLEF
jgi:hypothetical protein